MKWKAKKWRAAFILCILGSACFMFQALNLVPFLPLLFQYQLQNPTIKCDGIHLRTIVLGKCFYLARLMLIREELDGASIDLLFCSYFSLSPKKTFIVAFPLSFAGSFFGESIFSTSSMKNRGEKELQGREREERSNKQKRYQLENLLSKSIAVSV